MQTILVDPYPREMKLIFTPKKLQLLKKNYQLINVPNRNKQNFYEKNIDKADFIIGQPDLPSSLLVKAKKLNAATIKILRNKAKKSKVFTYSDLVAVYRRGQAAWTSGSRPGIGMAQWAMARVNSLLKGSRKHDTDIRSKAMKRKK